MSLVSFHDVFTVRGYGVNLVLFPHRCWTVRFIFSLFTVIDDQKEGALSINDDWINGGSMPPLVRNPFRFQYMFLSIFLYGGPVSIGSLWLVVIIMLCFCQLSFGDLGHYRMILSSVFFSVSLSFFPSLTIP